MKYLLARNFLKLLYFFSFSVVVASSSGFNKSSVNWTFISSLLIVDDFFFFFDLVVPESAFGSAIISDLITSVFKKGGVLSFTVY